MTGVHLPFWTYVVDDLNGGAYEAVHCDVCDRTTSPGVRLTREDMETLYRVVLDPFADRRPTLLAVAHQDCATGLADDSLVRARARCLARLVTEEGERLADLVSGVVTP